ncbi:hypothetical protein HY990_04210 [Candidatus Micrarchaeota archaeon]|nr:hypothetical protein [Candidatus Micrarchaeota archaeon]
MPKKSLSSFSIKRSSRSSSSKEIPASKVKLPVQKISSKTDSVSSSNSDIDFFALEEQALMKADKTIIAIEKFLATWDSSKVKPPTILPQVQKIKSFYASLLSWQKESLKSRAKKDPISSQKRLRSFVSLCKSYS